ncbi:adenylate/guanylate cyclase domain-containing protein [Streptacidiphilus sp. P02-A3a]|uniref:adenylate/guanylate cyclase domain-containing protein n=1 Tax=Streptacidiphilus sp. P02-A3a TaxID=2704468 RepID=UPI0015F7C129|nr:adenylate/guanylate cyclase domain-containing protein [Streptacidiphilus sp. P02-A3a]QMU73257.1 AAA family ATPase [Streptacidiphilus sp. P02-A3a]
MVCTACQSPVPAGARFCPSCGARAATAAPARESRKTVTVLFCDMTDSTALSGRLDPELLRDVMVRYYALMRSCLERHGGTVEKYIGDAVVAVFGVPVLHEDDALRALRAAADMVAALEPLNLELSELFDVRIGIRIGVNTGEVVAAADAASDQVLTSGEAVNVAARLQQHAAPGEVILGPVTHSLVAASAVVVPIGELALKGKAEPVPAWRLLEPPPVRPAGAWARDEPMVGRATELAWLLGLLDQVTGTAEGRLAVLYGDAGVGKTRLAAEFAAVAAARGVLVGAGGCPPYGEGRTLHALGEALGQVVERARALGSLGPEQGQDLLDALAYLDSGLLRDGAPGGLPEQLGWAATLVLETVGRQHPVLLLLDDLQWAKPALLDLLRGLCGRLAGTAVLTVGLARPDLLERHPGWGCDPSGGGATEGSMTLGPLSAAESELLVAALSEVLPHRADLVDQLVARAEGNPFFLEQLVAITEQGGADTLPPTVQSLIAARLDLLTPVEREVLLRATVPGRRFSTPELEVLLGEEPPVAERPGPVLGTLGRRRLIAAEGGAEGRRAAEGGADGYRFSGALIREVAYNTLSKRTRVRYHQRLAVWYRQQRHGCDLVGLHLEHAYRLAAELGPADQPRVLELKSGAARNLATAGAVALRRSDLHWAAELLGRAQGLHDPDDPGRLTVGLHLAEARLLLGTDPRARDDLRDLADAARGDGDQRTACHVQLLRAALELPTPTAAEDALAAVPVFEADGDQLGLARAWLRVGQLRQLGGRYGEAEELLRRALRHALLTDAQLELATAIGGLATSLWRGPTPATAALAGCRTLLAEHAGGRRAVRATVNCPLAVLLAYRGEFTEARALVADSVRIIGELGHAYGAASLRVFAATVEGLAGDWRTAERLLREAAAAADRLGDTLAAAVSAAGLARALLEQGRHRAALESAEGTAGTGDPFLDAELHGVRARALASCGEPEPALREAALAVATAAGTDSTGCQATAELDRAHVLLALGEDLAAAGAAAAAERLFRAKGHLVGAEWAAATGARTRPSEGK